MPLLSIVIPTWNRADSLIALIESIEHKDDKKIEIVISDDASCDESFQKIENFSYNYRNIFIYRNSENIGMVKNWNASINKAKGEWICFICDDDLFYSNGVDRIINLIETIATPSLVIQSQAITTQKESLAHGVETVRKLQLPIVSGNFWHREITDRLGGFDERIKYSPDAEFWYRIAYSYPVIRIKEPFAKYISHENNYAYTTWDNDDFIDQVSLITKINSTYFNEKWTITHDNSGKDSTVFTILNTTFMRRGKKELFNKYYQIGLESHKQRGDALTFRITVIILCAKIIIIFLKKTVRICLKKIFIIKNLRS